MISTNSDTHDILDDFQIFNLKKFVCHGFWGESQLLHKSIQMIKLLRRKNLNKSTSIDFSLKNRRNKKLIK